MVFKFIYLVMFLDGVVSCVLLCECCLVFSIFVEFWIDVGVLIGVEF